MDRIFDPKVVKASLNGNRVICLEWWFGGWVGQLIVCVYVEHAWNR